jgi:SAM-dependent methyltransferase
MQSEGGLSRLVAYQWIVESYTGIKHAAVLEVGCASGAGAMHLAQKAQRVVSVDTSKKLIERAAESFRAKNLKFQICEPTRLGSFSSKFDIICVPDLCWFALREALLAEVKRLLSDNGWALIAVPSDSNAEATGLTFDAFRTLLQPKFRQLEFFVEVPFSGRSVLRSERSAGAKKEAKPAFNTSLVDTDGPPETFIALCAPKKLPHLGEGMFQTPMERRPAPRRPAVTHASAELEHLQTELAKLRAEAEHTQWRKDELEGWKRTAQQYEEELARVKMQLTVQAKAGKR